MRGNLAGAQIHSAASSLFACATFPPMTDPTAHQTLTDKVTEQIRRRLINGEFAPGQRLSEATLTQSMDVSVSYTHLTLPTKA